MGSTGDIVGRVLDGKYRIERLLGRGGMGEVYAGTHMQLERPVAVKVLHGDLGADDSFAARFVREARTAARLEHPNAVHVYDFGSLESGSAYLVMEFVEGVTLREVMRANDRFPLSAVVDIMRQAAGAIGAAHARGIVHRDIKPENMMVRTNETGRLVLKVVDFGLAKLLENQSSQLTNGSELIGTPKYMAPEQFSGGRVDERADVYALGCVLFELLAGGPPFEGTFVEVVGKHVYAEVPSFESLDLDLSPEVEAVVRHALEKDPADRTPSASELVAELERAAGHASETAPAADALTIPLPKSVPIAFESGPSSELYVTRPTPAQVDEYQTRDASGAVDVSTRVRPDDPPTVFVPQGLMSADPQTRVMKPGRPTALDLDPPVKPPRRVWSAILPAALAAVLAASATGYWASHRDEPAAAPAASPIVPAPAEQPAPTPLAPTPPATVAEPAVQPVPAPAEPPQHRQSSSSPEPRRSEPPRKAAADPDDVPEPPDVDADPDGRPTPREIKRLRRMAREIERQRRMREGAGPPRRPRPRP